MPKVPPLQAKEVVRALKRLGFIEDRQKGSHLVMWNPKTGARTVVPMHFGKTLKRGLLFGIIKDAQVSTEEFTKAL
ncbi:type II toxin-antitoxin system HicA family toxin [Candidatus Uhrbacteria bacterium]|nr:type II toxin-antitoxin system HicA family toxin [Candidatus Uhrbacteria bacterium]